MATWTASGIDGKIDNYSLLEGQYAGGDYYYNGNVILTLTPSVDVADYYYDGNVVLTLTPSVANALDYVYDGSVTLTLTPSVEIADYYYDGNVSLSLTPSVVIAFDYLYDGNVVLSLTPAIDVALDYYYDGNVTLSLTPSVAVLQNYEYNGNAPLRLSPGADYSITGSQEGGWENKSIDHVDGVDTMALGERFGAYLVKGVVTIDGVDVSSDLCGEVSVSVNAGAAADFSVGLNTGDAPDSFLGKEIAINILASDGLGVAVSSPPIVIGVIRAAELDVDSGAITLAGYDYGGKHNELGELYSGEINTFVSGEIDIGAPGLYDTGHSPIQDVEYRGEADIEDGVDYLVDVMNGKIYVPYSSNFPANPGRLYYRYPIFFNSITDLIQALATLKGWEVAWENITPGDYVSQKDQPIITLSNESVIDALKKTVELCGGWPDTALYPALRIYSSFNNSLSDDKVFFDESTIYEGSLKIETNVDKLLTEQTVRSVAPDLSKIEISDWENGNLETGSVDFFRHVHYQYYVGYTAFYEAVRAAYNNFTWKLAATMEFSLDGVYEYSLISVVEVESFDIGDILGIKYPQYKIEEIVDFGTKTLIVNLYQEEHHVHISMQQQTEPYRSGVYDVDLYAGIKSYSIQFRKKEAHYASDTAAPAVEVTGRNVIEGVTRELVGDVYDHPFIRTVEQATALDKEILYAHSLKRYSSFDAPLFAGYGLKVGKRINVSSRGVNYDGVISSLAYQLNLGDASGAITIGFETK